MIMVEKENSRELQDPTVVNPFEIKDLMIIDTGKMTFDDVMEYATNLVIYYESFGKVRFNSVQEKRFKDAKKVYSWLKKEQYSKVIRFFIKKSKESWRGPIISGKYVDEYTMRIYDSAEIITIPWNVQVQGDDAIKEFLVQERDGLHLRLSLENSATYLKQAAILAKFS